MEGWSEAHTTLGDVKERVTAFLKERAWEKAHSPKNLAMSIAIEAAELMEIYQWVPSEAAYEVSRDPQTFEHIQEEVADVVIYCVSLARALNFDLARAIERKIAKNGVKYPVPR